MGNKRFKKTVITLFSLMLLFMVSNVLIIKNKNYKKVDAESKYSIESDINVAQITDINYYPLKYCYKNFDKGFKRYYENVMFSQKLMIENSVIFDKSLENIKSYAEELSNKNKNLDFLIVSGGLTYSGEFVSHIHVANALRKLQNEIRDEYNSDFQILVTFGSQDINNLETYDYSSGDVVKVKNASYRDLYKIYAGLGYPDLTVIEGKSLYDYKDINYQHSLNSTSCKFKYINDNIQNNKPIKKGDLTYLVSSEKAKIFSIDTVADTKSNGNFNIEMKNFINFNIDESKINFAFSNQNFISHYKYQDTLLPSSIVKNSEENSGYLADTGIKYLFSGKSNSNSINNTISFYNNPLTEISTASINNVGAAIRYNNISKGVKGDKKAEKFNTMLKDINGVDISFLIDENYLTSEYLKSKNLTNFISNYKIFNLNDYIKNSLFENLVSDFKSRYITPSIYNMVLTDGINQIINVLNVEEKVANMIKGYDTEITQLIYNLISELEAKILNDYKYKGNNPIFKNENKLLAFLDDNIDELMDLKIGGEYKIYDLIKIAMYSYYEGKTYKSINDLPIDLKKGLESIKSGDAMKVLFDYIFEDNGIFSVVKKLLTTNLDLSKNLTEMNKLLKSLDSWGFEIDLKNLNINNLVTNLNKGLELDIMPSNVDFLGFLEYEIETKVNMNFYKRIGNTLYTILENFILDNSNNGEFNKMVNISYLDNEFSYLEDEIKDVASVENGKLPSMINQTIGSDVYTSRNFVWFTDKRVRSSDIIYSTNKDMSNAKSLKGDFDMYAINFPDFDLGFYSILKTREIGRHTVNLVNLKENTTYYFKVGDVNRNYFSKVYSFNTKSKSNKAFEMLLFGDTQGYLEEDYNQLSNRFEAIKNSKIFENGIDLAISVGDNVDDSKNLNQYKYLYNNKSSFFTEIPNIIASGNHEVSEFKATKSYEKLNPNVIDENYNYSNLHYNLDIPPQDTSVGMYYSFDYSDVHFTVINTNDLYSEENGDYIIVNGEAQVDMETDKSKYNKMRKNQIDWIRKDLQSSKSKYRVVIMHKSLYSAGNHNDDVDVLNLRKQLSPIFSNYDVNLVVAGHEHTFTYSYYLDEKGKVVDKNLDSKITTKGTRYVTLGTLGNEFSNYKDAKYIGFGKNFNKPKLKNPTFGKLIYDGNNLFIEGYQIDLESYQINKISTKNNLGLILFIIISIVVVASSVTLSIILIKKKKNKLH